MSESYVIGVDVGTSSARAALVSLDGKVLYQESHPIKIWNPLPDHYEQSSVDIWNAVCICVKSVGKKVLKNEIKAISFDATCSLVVLEKGGQPLSVSTTLNPQQNVILWMDHRAFLETEKINSTKNDILRNVGGKVSLEMQMPKLCWLKNNLSTWKKIWRAFDLPDFLTWRSTDSDVRSLCSVGCKWNFDVERNKWDASFLKQIQLEELCQNDFEIIGRDVYSPGESIGQGLSKTAAEELDLLPGTKVGVSLIDAYAGALGIIGCHTEKSLIQPNDFEKRLALICGTSTCHLSVTKEPCWAYGIWGPYKDALFKDYYVNEAGQSATGLLLDNLIKMHPQYEQIKSKLKENEDVHSYMNSLVNKITKERKLDDPCFLTNDFHIWPDFHGNRSPIADSTLRGMISGIGMDSNEESLAVLYVACIQALAYGTRHIIDHLLKHNRPNFDVMIVCGGLSKNSLYIKSHADACQISVIVPNEKEMVLVGTAMLGARAANIYSSLEEASQCMSGTGNIYKPNQITIDYHKRKYCVFLEMLNDQRKYINLMKNQPI